MNAMYSDYVSVTTNCESLKVVPLRCYTEVCCGSKDIWVVSKYYMLLVIEETVFLYV